IQVASELPVCHHLLKIAMRSRNHTNIHLLCTGTAQSFKFAFLQQPQQFRLKLEWNVTYFIEKQSALVCNLETPGFAHGGAGKCAPLMPKKLAFQQPGGNGGAVQFNKRANLTRAPVVDLSSDHLFSRSRLS